jgi:hypothetical protein
MADLAKFVLTKIGERASESGLFRIADAALNYVEVGRWMRVRNLTPPSRTNGREDIFDLVGRQIGHERVLYLEFGVWHGDTMRHWSGLLSNPAAHLHGFDSFEGLPEKWHAGKGPGYFSTGGTVPTIDDGRVRFFKGWFRDTLKDYSTPDHERMVINIDADLYSSTMEVLNHFASAMRPGTFLYFDEFSDRNHELKAFEEFLAGSGLRFRLVAASRSLSHVMFEVID